MISISNAHIAPRPSSCQILSGMNITVEDLNAGIMKFVLAMKMKRKYMEPIFVQINARCWT